MVTSPDQKRLFLIPFLVILLFLVAGCQSEEVPGETSTPTSQSTIIATNTPLSVTSTPIASSTPNAYSPPAIQTSPRTLDTTIYEETEHALPSDVRMLSIKKLDDNRYIGSYFDPQTQQYGLAYTDPEFKTITRIGNDAGKLIYTSSYTASGEFAILPPLIYDVDRNGNIYIVQYKVNTTPTVYFILVYDSEGVLQNQIQLENAIQIQNLRPTKLLVQENRFILLAYGGYQVLDREGNTLSEYEVPKTVYVDPISQTEYLVSDSSIVDGVAINDKEVVVIQNRSDTRYLIRHNLADNQIVWEREISLNFVPSAVQYDAGKQQILVMTYDRIITYGLDGSATGELINFNDYEAGSHSSLIFQQAEALQPKFVVMLPPDQLYVYMTAMGTYEIGKIFDYRELTGAERDARLAEREAQLAKKTKLVWFVSFKDATTDQIKVQFERLNPDIHVEVSHFRENYHEYNAHDYLQYVNLQLMAGKTRWDVMSVTDLPFWIYSRKGYFANLYQIASNIWNREKDKYFANILEAMRVDGKRTVFPTRVWLLINMMDKQLAARLSYDHTWNDLIQLANEVRTSKSDMKSWNLGTHNTIFDRSYDVVLHVYLNDILDTRDNTKAREQLLGEFLDTIKTLSNPDDHMQQTGQTALFTLQTVNSPLYGTLFNDKNRTLLPGPASPLSSTRSFAMTDGYAINANSEVKEEALRFILFIAEQATKNNIILKTSFDQALEQYGQKEERREIINQLRSIVESYDRYIPLSHQFPDEIRTTAEQYVNGIIGKEKAVKTIMEKLWFYENE